MKKSLGIEIGEDICELNCWRTPKRIKKVFKIDLTKDEIIIIMDTLEVYVPHKKWIKIWQKQDEGKYKQT